MQPVAAGPQLAIPSAGAAELSGTDALPARFPILDVRVWPSPLWIDTLVNAAREIRPDVPEPMRMRLRSRLAHPYSPYIGPTRVAYVPAAR